MSLGFIQGPCRRLEFGRQAPSCSRAIALKTQEESQFIYDLRLGMHAVKHPSQQKIPGSRKEQIQQVKDFHDFSMCGNVQESGFIKILPEVYI